MLDGFKVCLSVCPSIYVSVCLVFDFIIFKDGYSFNYTKKNINWNFDFDFNIGSTRAFSNIKLEIKFFHLKVKCVAF